MVDMGALISKGPNQGIFEVTVDGQPLLSALTIDLEIYKDMYNLNSVTKRITSSQRIELRPRNTGR